MPNTLAHIGVQGILNQIGKPGIDPKLVCLGCVIPDIPWILQRVVHGILPMSDPYFIRLYCIAQATLFVTLLLCGAIAFLSKDPKIVFLILGLNSFLHLVLDGFQTKWANGVHLFAPLSWEMWNWAWFWPESLPTYVMTGSGLLYFAWQWKNGINQSMPIPHWSYRNFAVSVTLLILYFTLPLFLIKGSWLANNHYVRTLEETETRPGLPIELDRSGYIKTSDGDVIETFAKEKLKITENVLDHSALVSIRGRLVTTTQVEIMELHEHSSWFRDVSSYLGLLLLSAMWLGSYLKRSKVPES